MQQEAEPTQLETDSIVRDYGLVGEVRFLDAESATAALNLMDGVPLSGAPLTLTLDPTSKDATKLTITGLPENVEWQELKDHFKQMPNLAFVNVKGGRRTGPKSMGEVRYETAEQAQNALLSLQGSEMAGGARITVNLDGSSKDGTKLIVSGIPAGADWQELKDHFSQVGPVAYAGILNKNAAHNAAFGGCGGPLAGEVRFESAEHSQAAVQMLHGSMLGSAIIQVSFSPSSADGTKLLVQGLAPGTAWQELKDHFSQIGPVAFAQVLGAGQKGKGRSNGPMGMSMDDMMGQGMVQGAFMGQDGGFGMGPYSMGKAQQSGMMPIMMMVPVGPDGQPMLGKGMKPVPSASWSAGGCYGKA